MGRVFDRLMPHYRDLGGERVADIGLFYSLDSRFDMRQNGTPLAEVDAGADTHTRGAMGAARSLIADHLPFAVVTRKSLGSSAGSGPWSSRTCITWTRRRLRRSASGFGVAARSTRAARRSLVDKSGQRRGDFMLADVLGASIVKAEWSDRDHYMAPAAAGRDLFPGWDAKYPAFFPGPGMEVRARDGATVLATTTLPWPAPDRRQFSSIHSNPPWVATDRPEVVFHRCGEGKCIYSASLLEEVATLEDSFIRLLRHLSNSPAFEVQAPPAVEVTLFSQPDRRRHLLNLLSFQHELPNIPVDGITIRLRLPQRVKSVRVLPTGQALRLRREGDTVVFTAPRLGTLLMLAVNHA